MADPQHHLSVPFIEARVEEKLRAGQALNLYGLPGSGKSHLIAQKVNGCTWGNLTPLGPLQIPRLLTDLEPQLPGSTSLFSTFIEGGLDAALREVDARLREAPLVIDQAEHLVGFEEDSLDSAHERALWVVLRAELRAWLYKRAASWSVILIGRARLGEDPALESLEMPGHPGAPVIALKAMSGPAQSAWEVLGEKLMHRPGGLVLARLLAAQVEQDEFVRWARWVREECEGPREVLLRMARLLRARLPSEWMDVLLAVDALEDLEAPLVERILQSFGAPWLWALKHLSEARLIQEHHGRLRLMPLALDAGLLEVEEERRRGVLRLVAPALHEDLRRYGASTQERAASVLRLHSIYMQLGDFDNAHRTAQGYAAGLIDVARLTSLSGRYEDARAQYASILRMLPESLSITSRQGGVPSIARGGSFASSLPRPSAEPTAMKRLRSYALHYHAWNGARAGTLPLDAVCEGYNQAIVLWPDNALWHSNLITALGSDSSELARDALRHAERAVPAHDLRDTLLRLRPAWTLLDHGRLALALELAEPAFAAAEARDPTGVLDSIREALQASVTQTTLDAGEAGRLSFLLPQALSFVDMEAWWRVALPATGMWVEDETPGRALDALARKQVEEAKRLLRGPIRALAPGDLQRRQRLLAVVDVLNSELGVKHPTHRWLLGRFEGHNRFYAQQPGRVLDLAPEVARALGAPPSPDALWFAWVPTWRDGVPSGPVERLEPAGSRGDDPAALLQRAWALSLKTWPDDDASSAG